MDYKLGRTNAPLVDRSVVLVVSTLVSLMIDQVRSEVFLLQSLVPVGGCCC